MSYQNMQHLMDNLFATQRICSWTLSTDLQLLSTNCPHQEFFFNLFSISRCPAAIREHFSASDNPLIVADKIGFAWIVAARVSEEEAPLPVVYLLGPIFTSDMTRQYLGRHLSMLQVSADTAGKLWQFIDDIPRITVDFALSFACMFCYSALEKTINNTDIRIWLEPVENREEARWGETTWHGTWQQEQQLFQSIREGRIMNTNRIQGRIGNIGGGDPLRQAKNEMIIFSVICSRASILGGVSSEGAYNLSDYYLQRIEAAPTISAVQSTGLEMYRVFIQRVGQAKSNSTYSFIVRSCLDYVETHIWEKIILKDMASEIGYHENYISRSFKKEYGKSLFDHINGRKIQVAKSILSENNISLGDVSSALSFSSTSYFCSVFKKETGMTPMEYQEKCRQERFMNQTI